MEGSHGWLAEKKLYDAAVEGDTIVLGELLENDPLLLCRVPSIWQSKTPLHVATMQGHLPFVHEILIRSPRLAEDLDSQQSSALHSASAHGNVEIVKELLLAAPDMCLSRDCQGRTPLHLAVVKGRVEVLAELIHASPLAAEEKTDRGLTLLHLCVKHQQLEALKTLVRDFKELLNVQDDDGDTILHMAVRKKQIETIQYLVQSISIDAEAKNYKGETASDIFEKCPTSDIRNLEISEILKRADIRRRINNSQSQAEEWLSKKRDAIMVVAALIATMAFQAELNPAGGVWQDDYIKYDSHRDIVLNAVHNAGEAVMGYKYPIAFNIYSAANTLALVLSLGTILLLISGLPFRKRLFMWILMVIMWITVTSIAVTYGLGVEQLTNHTNGRSPSYLIVAIAPILLGFVNSGVLVGHFGRLTYRLYRRGLAAWKARRQRNLARANHENVDPGQEAV